jgi:hypothetical protein
VDFECGRATTGTICEHARRFYDDIAGTPIVFWRFSTQSLQILYPEANLEQQDSPKGDKCHYNIVGLSDSQAKRFFSPKIPIGFYYCCENIDTLLTSENCLDLTNFKCPEN